MKANKQSRGDGRKGIPLKWYKNDEKNKFRNAGNYKAYFQRN